MLNKEAVKGVSLSRSVPSDTHRGKNLRKELAGSLRGMRKALKSGGKGMEQSRSQLEEMRAKASQPGIKKTLKSIGTAPEFDVHVMKKKAAFVRGVVDELEKAAIEGPSLSSSLRVKPDPSRTAKDASPGLRKVVIDERKKAADRVRAMRKEHSKPESRVILSGMRGSAAAARAGEDDAVSGLVGEVVSRAQKAKEYRRANLKKKAAEDAFFSGFSRTE
jgi:hypothetical protein